MPSCRRVSLLVTVCLGVATVQGADPLSQDTFGKLVDKAAKKAPQLHPNEKARKPQTQEAMNSEKEEDHPDWERLIHYARMDKLDKIKDLVAKGADIFDDENEEGRGHTAFDATCNAQTGNLDILDYVIGIYKMHSRSLDKPDFKGRTPLFNACKTGYVTAIEMLLRHGADPTLKAEDVACGADIGYCDCWEIAQAPKIDRGQFSPGVPKPHWGDHPEVIAMLEEWKADPEAFSKNGYSWPEVDTKKAAKKKVDPEEEQSSQRKGPKGKVPKEKADSPKTKADKGPAQRPPQRAEMQQKDTKARLREELKAELRAELKAEVEAELKAEVEAELKAEL